jgi:hypothetical protein
MNTQCLKKETELDIDSTSEVIKKKKYQEPKIISIVSRRTTITMGCPTHYTQHAQISCKC